MAVCRKCNTTNEEGLTRCQGCNAILPVKLGSKSEVRFERVRRKPELVGAKCPQCETVNPYTRFKCSNCGASLAGKKRSEPRWERIWIDAGTGAAIAAAIYAVFHYGI
jgi:hypothetical protein